MNFLLDRADGEAATAAKIRVQITNVDVVIIFDKFAAESDFSRSKRAIYSRFLICAPLPFDQSSIESIRLNRMQFTPTVSGAR